MHQREHSRERLLIVAPNWLGDLVMATVLLEALADPASGAGRRPRLHLVVRRRWLPLLQDDPRIDRLVAWERTGRHAGWRGLFRLSALWRAERCAAVLLLPPSLRVALAARLAGIPRRFGYRSDGRALLLTDGLSLARRGSQHYTAEVLALGRAWVESTGNGPWPTASAPLPALPGCAVVAPPADMAAGPPCWVLAPGATYGEAKAWPAPRVGEFLRLAVHEQGARVVLLGDASTRQFVAALRAEGAVPWRTELAGEAAAVDLTGRTDLRQAVALLKGAALFLGNDSGLMHLAAALGVPTLGLFGSTSPRWTGPRGPRTAVLAAAGFDCMPCFLRRCPRPVFCLDTLAGDAVLAAARRLLEPAPEKPSQEKPSQEKPSREKPTQEEPTP